MAYVVSGAFDYVISNATQYHPHHEGTLSYLEMCLHDHCGHRDMH